MAAITLLVADVATLQGYGLAAAQGGQSTKTIGGSL
jgi:hypothetical protein